MISGKRQLTLLLLAAVATIGCDGKSARQSELEPYRAKFVLPSAPAKAAWTPTDVKEKVTSPTSLALAGRIDAGDTQPFQAGLATFVLSQLPDQAHAGEDPNHADNCPFCKRKLANAPKAVVQFMGEDGELLAVDARELFGVAKGDIVVVQGTAEYLEAVDTVQINADGIFVRR
jgi:hypothetical protein